MTKELFRLETERINDTCAIRVYKNNEIVMEINNWNSLSSSNAMEVKELVKTLNEQALLIEKYAEHSEELDYTIENLRKENEELKQLLTKDKTIKNILPALHTELKDILHEECEKYRKMNDNDAVATLNKLAYDLGIIENKEIL